MKDKTHLFLVSAAIFTFPFIAASAGAVTVTSKTVTQEVSSGKGAKMINLADFDLNKDSVYSTFEIGEMLFKLFDTNHSDAIDPKEYENKSVITVVPMKTVTTIAYDYSNSGVADKTQYSVQEFMSNTLLSQFDQNKDGLSPHEFIGQVFSAIDTDGNKSIDLTEWRDAYVSKVSPAPAQ